MDTTRNPPPAAANAAAAARMAQTNVPTPASFAKGALRRLAQAQQEPTPENYARAYAEESGQTQPSPASLAAAAAAELKAQGAAWAALTERLARNLDRGGKQWTGARRKESLKRLFDGSRSDPQRLQQRLQSLLAAWETDQPSDPAQTGAEDPPLDSVASVADAGAWQPLAQTLHTTVRAALPADVAAAAALAAQLAAAADALAAEGATPARVAQIDALCQQAQRMFVQRHRLVDELGRLCRELTAGLTDLAEDESWARGQCASLHATLNDPEGLSVRGLRSVGHVLAGTRLRQQRVRSERQAARDAFKQLMHDMLIEVGEIGEQAGRFEVATEQHAQAIQSADSLEGLAEVVRAMLRDARAVQAAVGHSQQRLQADRSRAEELEAKVRELEGELRRLSDEVSTDALTQVANRRGLQQAFEAESARCARAAGSGAGLAVGLIDIDNFKKLNDSLGHAAGDQALKTLAAAVKERLRPVDHLARFGGEEFVVLLPDTAVSEAQQALTRLQRSLTEALFLHDGREVFVTFSAGVTAWQPGEPLQPALERADEALYEAKRTGKNRTCIG
jgi:diguanylate cyclase